MRIPTSFPLLGHKITVKVIPKAEWPHDAEDGQECVGIWLPDDNAIELLAEYKGTKREQAYCHEWVHAMLTMMCHPLATDEVFVDQLGSLIHQSLSGAKHTRKPHVKG